MLSLPGTQHPYAYGLNNPLRYTDPSGKFVGILLTGAAISAGVNIAYQIVDNAVLAPPDKRLNFQQAVKALDWNKVIVAGVVGAVSGGVAATLAPVANFVMPTLVSWAGGPTLGTFVTHGLIEVGRLGLSNILGEQAGALTEAVISEINVCTPFNLKRFLETAKQHGFLNEDKIIVDAAIGGLSGASSFLV
ncbi:MAG: hypothetical protein ACP5J4_14635, partial [Anaerolineae bacterium]